MTNYFQINKLSKLHDGKNIIFCKTDFIQQEFQYINTLENDVIFYFLFHSIHKLELRSRSYLQITKIHS